jgi:two-component system chemotaxis sensor kinase CheA
MDDLLQEFIAETRETLEALAGEVVAWEAAPEDRTRLDSIFRFVHTVKGSCGFLNLPRLGRLSHAAEDVLADVRADRRKPDGRLVSAVLAIIDRIGELTEALDSGASVPDGEDQLLIDALRPEAAAPLEAPVAVPQTPVPARGAARSIRLPVELLDRMMASVSDTVLARNELSRKLRDSEAANAGVEVAFERLSACIAEMRDAITRTRMARIDNLFSALPRTVRDLSGELGKSVLLGIDGGDVELDREMIEMIRDPLTHIVRNAIDHGIEPPEERRAAGKHANGHLRVCARQAGNQILIEVSDDGRGIDGDRLVRKAIASGILDEKQAEGLSWSRKLDLVFEPGLSTAKAVTAISGRGVGMDVVRANIERIGGVVDIDSKPGHGLRLTLRVPLTLTIIPALTVSAAGQQFAIPRSAIEEIVRARGEAVRIEQMGGATVAIIRGQRLPVVALGPFLDSRTSGEVTILVVLKPAGRDRYALAVDAVHDHEELVVKPAAPAVMATGIYAGTTLPDNSRPMLLLDVAGVATAAGVLDKQSTIDEDEHPAAEQDIEGAFQALLFRDLDGIERAVALSLVHRIEDVAAAAIATRAGRLRLVHDGLILPVTGCAQPIAGERVRILRMSDGATQIAYAIESVLDIIEIGAAFERTATPGPIAGVALIEGRPVELLDAFHLFAEVDAAPAQADASPLCLLADAGDAWTRQILEPLVRAAGYRTTFAGAADAAVADIVVDPGTGAADTLDVDAPVIRLRATPDAASPGDSSVYRYDRAGLVAALGRHARKGR